MIEQERKESISTTKTYTAPAELGDSTKIKAFQDWMDKYRPLWINDNGTYKNLSKGTATEPNRHVSGKGYGTYGKNTNTAWTLFGKEYISSINKSTDKGGDKPKSDINKDIQTIINKGTGSKADKTYLQGANKDYVSEWAKAIRKSKTYFIWANQVYSVNKGDKILEFNPINKVVYSITDKLSAFTEADLSKGATTFQSVKGDEVGQVKAIKYDTKKDILWAYIPDNKIVSNYDWFAMKYLTKTKSKSSFEGVKFEPMSSMDAFDITM